MLCKTRLASAAAACELGLAAGSASPAVAQQAADLCGRWSGTWDLQGSSRPVGGPYMLTLTDCSTVAPVGEVTAWVASTGRTETYSVTDFRVGTQQVAYRAAAGRSRFHSSGIARSPERNSTAIGRRPVRRKTRSAAT